MKPTPVIAIFDVGKTNKKLFLFDENYKIVYEKTARFTEIKDEDGFPCENLESLKLSVFDSLNEVFRLKEFDIKAINFSTYGASLVFVDEDGNPLTPLYNYLKPYPEGLSHQLYHKYGGEDQFASETASPVLGSLNSALVLYRLKKENPEIFSKVKYALHLPQYMSCLLSRKFCSDITSIGCHTAMWDFSKNDYHQWIKQEGLLPKLAPIVSSDTIVEAEFKGDQYKTGIGLHDSSAALIPYQVSFSEPFVLISTGTWCISMNPFNNLPLTKEELKSDCLCYLEYHGKPVKSSRLFAGHDHEQGVKRIADYFNQDMIRFRTVAFEPELIKKLQKLIPQNIAFRERDMSLFEKETEAYHQLMLHIMHQQKKSTALVLKNTPVKRIFVDGGFSKNAVYMNLLASAFPGVEVYAASMAQATAIGAAMAIHQAWNSKPLPGDIIELKYYSPDKSISL
ncbi:MAG TPA: FGGY family carbohydrate kinase [Mucilaginibacter sp.]